jgi:hypothetical protein
MIYDLRLTIDKFSGGKAALAQVGVGWIHLANGI